MKPLLTIATLLFAVTGAAFGQVPYYDSVYEEEPAVEINLPVPDVRINDRAATFQASLYPDFYSTNSVRNDMLWLREHDSSLTEFWHKKGDSTLYLLAQFSGLDWVEDRFDLYALRYYPSFGGSDPLVIPVGGRRQGVLTVAAPEGAELQLNVIYQLAQRMLAQAERAGDPFYRALADHPLMRPGPYRRDNLALLLALVTAQHIIGMDSTLVAYQSAFWRDQTLGREVFEKYLLADWILTPEKPLAQWILDESYNSRLVAVTKPPERKVDPGYVGRRVYVEGLPLKGELGFSVTVGDNNRLTIDKIDPYRVAYACGLREGDQIRSVDGKRLRTQKQMIEFILEGYDAGGSTLGIQREGDKTTILLRPVELFEPEEGVLYYEGIEDTLYFEPIPPDSVIDTTAPSAP